MSRFAVSSCAAKTCNNKSFFSLMGDYLVDLVDNGCEFTFYLIIFPPDILMRVAGWPVAYPWQHRIQYGCVDQR